MNDRQKCYILYKAKRKSLARRNGCIEWTGVKNQAGYGILEYTDEITKKRHCLPVHRAVYMIHHNLELERRQFVCHRCDNPACINLKHLWLGTPKDNAQDKVSKERYAKKITYHHRVKKYPHEKIELVKVDLRSGMKMLEVAKKHGLSQSYVWGINYGRNKKHVTDSEVYPLYLPKTFKGFCLSLDQKRPSPYDTP